MKKGFKASVLFILLLLLLVMNQSCVIATKTTAIAPEIRSLFEGTYQVDPYMETHKPRTVAVLPFYDQSQGKAGYEAVRKGFYNHFSSLPYMDMELARVDDLLTKANLADPEAIKRTAPADLGKILGVDAVVYGDISNFDKLFALVYSQVSVGADIRMFDAKTGHFLWSGKHVVRIHEGGIATTPVGIIATVIATAMNVRDIQLLRACDDLFREMVKTIPSPPLAEALRPPVITLLTQDTKNLPKRAGDEIKVVIQGSPKMRASFDIGDFKKHIDMEEVEPGGYLGIYKVLPGDAVSGAVITGHLTDDTGNRVDWIDAIGTVTLDTVPPDKPGEPSALGRNATVLLNWEKSAAADLAGYRVYRSDTPLSGYREIARTEFDELRDENLTNGKRYYYQIAAYDLAGNEGEKTGTIAGMPLAPGPTPVSGTLDVDSTWYAGASPYIMEDDVVVRDMALLTIEPGTEIRSKGGALIVEGRLHAAGDVERLILFDAYQEDKPWTGIVYSNVKEKENLLAHCRIRNAITAVALEASSPRIEVCELTENGSALKIAGAFSKPLVSRNTIHKNREAAVVVIAGAQPLLLDNRILDNDRTGILIQSASPVIRRNTIARNGSTGVAIQASQAVIEENTIIDNKPLDMSADMTGEPVHALNNWWGAPEALEVLARIRGRINIASVLSGPPPEGKPLQIQILPQVLGGAVKTDAFLTLANSPYRVSRDLTVDGGATLYIEPGVTIQYDQNMSINVEDGGVMARGTQDNPIHFCASAVSASPGFYRSAVRFKKATEVNSAFAYCFVRNASVAFDIYFGDPDISFCHIADNAQSGVYCRNDTAPRIRYSTFSGNRGEGAVNCVGMSNPSIHFNNFIDNEIAIRAFSSIYIDARQNWWGNYPPDPNMIWGDPEKNINVNPALEVPEEKAFAVGR
ncbi:MAG: DUF799 family lipoprotein [Deltaproteobacteria bacterium]|nr:DUF799 family lipoprotein [Deltaproteobacteria bacterium]